MAALKPPPGLGKRGAGYWTSITSTYDLSDSEREILREVCRCLDDLDALAAAIARDGVTTAGSAGQVVVHPAVTEARGLRLTMHRLVSAMALPDADGETVPSAGTMQRRAAIASRWAGHIKDDRSA